MNNVTTNFKSSKPNAVFTKIVKVYTYYENINFSHQEELLEIWQKSWENNGFEVNVLNRSDAEKHSFYNEYVKRLESIHLNLTDKPITKYGLSCWLRWLAYATQPEEKFYVCDYDVINHNFTPVEPNIRLHLMDDHCPCIASGTPSQFFDLCKQIVNFTEKNLPQFKEKLYNLISNLKDSDHHKITVPQFHDQQFFTIYTSFDKDGIYSSRNRETFLSTPNMHEFWKKPLVHYGSGLCDQYLQRFSKKFTHQARIELIEKHLNKTG